MANNDKLRLPSGQLLPVHHCPIHPSTLTFTHTVIHIQGTNTIHITTLLFTVHALSLLPFAFIITDNSASMRAGSFSRSSSPISGNGGGALLGTASWVVPDPTPPSTSSSRFHLICLCCGTPGRVPGFLASNRTNA